MRIFKPLITIQELNEIFNSNKDFDRHDLYKIASVTHSKTLVSHLGDIQKDELEEVHQLESRNLYRIINATRIMLKKDDELYKVFTQSEQYKELVDYVCSNENDKKIQERYIFNLSTKLLLSGNHKSTEMDAIPRFYGIIPKKLFSFRQNKANEWFNAYLDFVLHVSLKIQDKGGNNDDVYTYIQVNTVWYLNKSQTEKYHQIPEDNTEADRNLRIFLTFIKNLDGGENKIILKNSRYNSKFFD